MRGPACLLVLLAACTDGRRDVAVEVAAVVPVVAEDKDPARPVRPVLVVDPPRRLQGYGLVIEEQGEGARLCMQGWAESRPPQCGGMALANWDWDAVEGEEVEGTTRWGEYSVVGDFDGWRLSVVRSSPGVWPRPVRQVDRAACVEPPGGWERPEPARTGLVDAATTHAVARELPGYAGVWLHYTEPGFGRAGVTATALLNAAFTRDAQRWTAKLRETWGGALCVVERARRSPEELARINHEIFEVVAALGLDVLDCKVDEAAGWVLVEVVYAEASHQAQLDARYGEGVVRLSNALRPPPRACKDGESLASGCTCEDRRCMDICCVDSACSHQADPDGGFAKCIAPRRGE